LLALALVALVALSGCEAYKRQSKAKALELSAREYIKAVRWSKFEAAAGFIRHRDGGPPFLDMERLKNVRVTDSDLTVSTDAPDAMEAQMTAVFDYYLEDAPAVRSITQTGVWWWDPLDESWYLDGTLPAF
jgi:hypothetical protein